MRLPCGRGLTADNLLPTLLPFLMRPVNREPRFAASNFVFRLRNNPKPNCAKVRPLRGLASALPTVSRGKALKRLTASCADGTVTGR
jgi:hypothetical protein